MQSLLRCSAQMAPCTACAMQETGSLLTVQLLPNNRAVPFLLLHTQQRCCDMQAVKQRVMQREPEPKAVKLQSSLGSGEASSVPDSNHEQHQPETKTKETKTNQLARLTHKLSHAHASSQSHDTRAKSGTSRTTTNSLSQATVKTTATTIRALTSRWNEW